jgi:hypothetical protein
MSTFNYPESVFPTDNVPQFDINETFSAVTQKIDKLKGGFILKVENVPKYYVKGRVMADRLDDLFSPETYLPFTFEEILKEVPQAAIRIMEMPEKPTIELLREREDSVFKQEDSWILNHETLRDSLTSRFVFYCVNTEEEGGPHENYSSLKTNCYVCGKKVKL